jgi:translocation protein SEC62
LQSPAYEKARKKNPLLPAITDRASLENTFKLLPMSLLALRVSKIDPHEGHNHAPGAHKTKRVKGLWTVRIEQQQDCKEDLHYVWFYEGAQIKQKLYAAGALALVFAIVMFPLWPIKMRLGVWYLSMGMLGLIGLFFVMAIFRLILFGVTMFVVPPGLWLYPNLFEDVGFFDSFRPVWAWQEVSFSISMGPQLITDYKPTGEEEKEEEVQAWRVCFGRRDSSSFSSSRPALSCLRNHNHCTTDY